jgi:hypothetical protein
MKRGVVRENTKMTLFDERERSEQCPKLPTQSDFDYHNVSARPGVAAGRVLMEKWFQQYPDEHKRDLRSRYRSRLQSASRGAFFELYLHQLLLRIGCMVKVHPPLRESVKHPDFLVTTSCGTQFYLEAVLAHAPSLEADASARRIAEVYECLNSMNSPNFFISVNANGTPATPPSAAGLRRKLEGWLATLDPDEVSNLFLTGRSEEAPRYHWTHDGWDIEFKALPKSPLCRGKPGVRPIGIYSGAARWMNTANEIRRAIKTKGRKYGRLDLPLVVCVNVLDHADSIDILNALIGDEQWNVSFAEGGSVASENRDRAPNGVFGVDKTPKNRRVSAVVVASELGLWTMGAVTPELFHHPWPYFPLAENIWPMPKWIANHEQRQMQRVDGVTASSLLGLPDRWPVSLD